MTLLTKLRRLNVIDIMRIRYYMLQRLSTQMVPFATSYMYHTCTEAVVPIRRGFRGFRGWLQDPTLVGKVYPKRSFMALFRVATPFQTERWTKLVMRGCNLNLSPPFSIFQKFLDLLMLCALSPQPGLYLILLGHHAIIGVPSATEQVMSNIISHIASFSVIFGHLTKTNELVKLW